MVFCNKNDDDEEEEHTGCHNPYFNRWFSAIVKNSGLLVHYQGHNPYFNRWFSAI